VSILRYVAKRLAAAALMLLALSIIIFTLTRLIGDPSSAYVTPQMTPEDIARIKEIYGFNEPIYVQYLLYMRGILSGDWGFSRSQGIPVAEAIVSFLPATLELAIAAFLISLLGGIALGTVSAVNQDRWQDHTTRVAALTGYALPGFFLGLILLYIFYVVLGWVGPGRIGNDVILTEFFPAGTFREYTGFLLLDAVLNGNGRVFWDALAHLILPAITLSFGSLALVTRVMRSSMLEVLGKGFVQSARAKGLPEGDVIRRHARRNALVPVTTVAGLYFGSLIGYSIMVELVFLWPGLGRWGARAALTLDHAAILGFAFLVGITYILANLVVDVVYGFLDPRIRVEG
jgi:peptide/nickel transport system permease protein